MPGPSPIRRLTRTEYNNTVADLLGDATHPAQAFPDEELALGFTNNAVSQTTSSLLIEKYENAAGNLAIAAVAKPDLLGCDAADDACVKGFIANFGLKAYRRPLAADEVDRLFAFYGTNKAAYDATTALRLMLQAMLQSPHFLYRVEAGGAGTPGSVARLSSYELASRLSYALWGTMPDQALLTAAGANELDTNDGVLKQAQRMIADSRAKQAVATFFEQWLDLAKVGNVEKSQQLFPAFTPQVRTLLRKEQDSFLGDVVFGGGNLNTLLLGNYTFMNKDLATFYGVTGPTGDAFEKVTLDPQKRAGMLTQAGFLAASAKIDQTSPVQRGLFVRERFLCFSPPPPPGDVNTSPPGANPSLTTRQRFAQHEASASCAGCHRLMDPIGLGFEQFDATGRWRDTEGGLAIDSSGEIVGAKDGNGTFNGALELATKLSTSSDVSSCVVKQWFRYAYGRSEADVDSCTLATLNDTFGSGQNSFQSLVVGLTQTEAFLYRTQEGPSK